MSSFLMRNNFTQSVFFRESSNAPFTSTRTAGDQDTTYVTEQSILGPDSGGKQTAVFWMVTTDYDDTTDQSRGRLALGTTAIQTQNMVSQDTTDRLSLGGMFAYSSSLGQGSTWNLQTSADNNGTIGRSGEAMVSLMLTGSDVFTSSSAALNTTSTTYATYISRAVPAGTYFIIGSACVGSNSTAGNPRFRIFDGTNTFGEMLDVFLQSTAIRSPYWHVFRRTLASTTTFSLQYRGDGTNQGIMQQGCLLALSTSSFQNSYYAENTGSVSTTNTAFVATLSNTFTIANPTNQHLLLAGAFLSGSSNASSFHCKLRNTTAAVDYTVEHIREPNATTEEYPTVVARIVTFTAASNTIEWQLRVETGGTTGFLKSASIALMDLGR